MYDTKMFHDAAEIARGRLQTMLTANLFPIKLLADDDENPTWEEFCFHRPYGIDGFRYVIQYDLKLRSDDMRRVPVRFRLDGHAIHTPEKRFHLQAWLNDVLYTDREDALKDMGRLLATEGVSEEDVWDYVNKKLTEQAEAKD